MIQTGTLKLTQKCRNVVCWKHFCYFTYNCIPRIGMEVKRKKRFLFSLTKAMRFPNVYPW